jgi:uncharacterized protein YjiS (DUF1127 family)
VDLISKHQGKIMIYRIKQFWIRLFPSGRRALDKRRLERLLRDAGLTKPQAMNISRQFFNPTI